MNKHLTIFGIAIMLILVVGLSGCNEIKNVSSESRDEFGWTETEIALSVHEYIISKLTYDPNDAEFTTEEIRLVDERSTDIYNYYSVGGYVYAPNKYGTKEKHLYHVYIECYADKYRIDYCKIF